MTPEQASSLAARTLAAIWCPESPCKACDADRERVAADLAGLTECWDRAAGYDFLDAAEQAHARRYADGLIRTAALYGVTP